MRQWAIQQSPICGGKVPHFGRETITTVVPPTPQTLTVLVLLHWQCHCSACFAAANPIVAASLEHLPKSSNGCRIGAAAYNIVGIMNAQTAGIPPPPRTGAPVAPAPGGGGGPGDADSEQKVALWPADRATLPCTCTDNENLTARGLTHLDETPLMPCHAFPRPP